MLGRLLDLLRSTHVDSTTEAILRPAVAAHEAGNRGEAEAGYRRVLEFDPDNAPATHFLGLLAHQSADHQQGLALISRSIVLSPDIAAFHANLGAVYGQLGKHDAAEAAFRKAINLRPEFAEAHMNLGIALEASGRFGEAIDEYKEAICLGSKSPADVRRVAKTRLARALSKCGRMNEAIEVQTTIVDSCKSPDSLEVLCTFSEMQGNGDQCIKLQRRLMEEQPNSAKTESALLYALLHDPAQSADDLSRAHLDWADRHANSQSPPSHGNDRSVSRSLRIGYVSPNLHSSPVPRFFEPILDAHNRNEFFVACYADGRITDDITGRIKSKADLWRPTSGMSDEQFCQCIVEDKIDILVDLTGHMADNRMTAFARRPAPVQVSYLYPHTTGMSAMTIRLTDLWVDLPGRADAFSSEKLVRLGPTAWCYRPPLQTQPISGLPALAKGHITFGSLNRLLKVNASVIETWARLLREVPSAKLLMLVEQEERGVWVRDQFQKHGIRGDRIETPARQTHRDYLNFCHRIDIALDTFPYNGHTTTYDMLWMGIPVVTLAGDKHVSRVGMDLLFNVGLMKLVASESEQYVRIATDLALDLPRLRELRANLRERMRCSALMDEAGLTHRIETAYREAWTAWATNDS